MLMSNCVLSCNYCPSHSYLLTLRQIRTTMENISELFNFIEKTSDDELRNQLIEYMKKHYILKAEQVGSARPDNRFKLKLKRVTDEVRNLAELIDFCFKNDFKLVGEECETGIKQPMEELPWYTIQTLAKKLVVSEGFINNAVKSGDLKCNYLPGTGKKNKYKRFTPEQVKEYCKILK